MLIVKKRVQNMKKNEYRILGNSLDDKDVFDVSKIMGAESLKTVLTTGTYPEYKKEKNMSKKAQEKKKLKKKFSWLFCAKGYLRKSDKCNRYMCLVFILQPMCLLRCCIINRMKS